MEVAALVLAASAIAIAVAAGPAVGAEGVPPSAEAGLERLRGKSVFFGHQSVGMNVLDGLQLLAARSGKELRITEVRPGTAIAPGTIGHAWVGENHAPSTKIDAFVRAVDALPAPGVDVALVKLCYVDFAPETDVAAILARYRAALDDLRRRHPHTTFVHVTAPVSTVQGGAKALLKQVMGKPPYGLVENVRREEYNQALRKAYGGKEPIFDLARIESTAPDGRVETVEWQGRRVPALVPAYTDDGGHLNEAGRLRAAAALVDLLAGLPDAPGAGAATT
ncbi:MAG: hypothetical protein WB493_10450, partial [Anaeromyxobacteraceae bacterium]